jgi:ribonuclease HI
MNWMPMLFRGERVWVRVDENGRTVLDGDGRAEMKYRETDARSYRPGASNLAPIAGAEMRAFKATPAAPSEGEGVKSPSTKKSAKKPQKSSAQSSSGTGSAADPNTIHVWTDGACTGNPGPMGIGIVVIGPEDFRADRGEFLGEGTNNIAELAAIGRGLEIAAERFAGWPHPIVVYTDSQYSIGLLSMGWKAKANQELVARLREQISDIPRLRFVKVAGHAGIVENERCDELARGAIVKRGTITG